MRKRSVVGESRTSPANVEDDLPARPLPFEGLYLSLILILYLLVTLAYGVVNPLFEAPDEHWHFFTAVAIADNGRLPVIGPGDAYDEWLSQEAAQPPLYYLLSAALIAPVDKDGAREALWPNKFASIGKAGVLLNVNRFVHTVGEQWPWQGYALAAHLLRLFSTVLGLGTLLCVYASGRLLWPGDRRRALLATGLLAFLPQYNFVHASITNDTLITFLASLALWQLVRLWLGPVTRRHLLLLGLTVGLAALAKNAGILLLLYSVGMLFLLALRGPAQQSRGAEPEAGAFPAADGSPRGLLARDVLLLVIFPAVLVAGWLWVRNWMLYGDVTAANQFVRLAGGARNYSLGQVLAESDGLWLSLLAVFGWFNLRPPAWVYWFWSGIAVLAVVGAAWSWLAGKPGMPGWSRSPARGGGMRRWTVSFLRRPGALSWLLAAWPLQVYAGLVMFMLRTEAAQGRLLFPALLPLALGVAFGWTAAPLLRRFAPALVPAAFLVTVLCLSLVIAPAYALPAQPPGMPPEATILDNELIAGLALEGALQETETAEPGDVIWLNLYWRRDETLQAPPELVLSVFGRQMAEIGKIHSYHGRGLYPATRWPTGQLVAERLPVGLAQHAAAPVLANIVVSIDGGRGGVEAGAVKIVPAEWPEPAGPALAVIDGAIAVTRAAITPPNPPAGSAVDVAVQWQVVAAPERALTTFLHLGQPDESPRVVGDGPPLDGDYPTNVWQAGEVIDDAYTLLLPADLPAGRYPIWIGMYDSETIERLPLVARGERQANDALLVGWLEVE